MQTFEINLGKSDSIQVGDFLKIICDTTGVRSKHIGRINMDKTSTRFDVDGPKSKDITKHFKGLRFKGRPLTVRPV